MRSYDQRGSYEDRRFQIFTLFEYFPLSCFFLMIIIKDTLKIPAGVSEILAGVSRILAGVSRIPAGVSGIPATTPGVLYFALY